MTAVAEVLPKARWAAVSLIERYDGMILCVWNKRYQGWSLPGGMMEPTDADLSAAQRRELLEETSLQTSQAQRVWMGPHGLKPQASERSLAEREAEKRASFVCLFRVSSIGIPRQTEADCPVCWMTKEEFVRLYPFGVFYEKVFKDIS
jgi:8-oxo-dGTP pyrophosphatase MutT (NUDIX family)